MEGDGDCQFVWLPESSPQGPWGEGYAATTSEAALCALVAMGWAYGACFYGDIDDAMMQQARQIIIANIYNAIILNYTGPRPQSVMIDADRCIGIKLPMTPFALRIVSLLRELTAGCEAKMCGGVALDVNDPRLTLDQLWQVLVFLRGEPECSTTRWLLKALRGVDSPAPDECTCACACSMPFVRLGFATYLKDGGKLFNQWGAPLWLTCLDLMKGCMLTPSIPLPLGEVLTLPPPAPETLWLLSKALTSDEKKIKSKERAVTK